jgi:hypothetical protein
MITIVVVIIIIIIIIIAIGISIIRLSLRNNFNVSTDFAYISLKDSHVHHIL